MSLKKLNTRLIDEAHRLASICKHLDFAAIAKHEPLAVAQLQQAIQILGIKKKSHAPVNSRASQPKAAHINVNSGADKRGASPQIEKADAIAAALHESGFADRIGRVYNSESKMRMVDFSGVSQRNGLPPFLYVIGPDFAPVAGYHGIFVTATDVYAAIFPKNGNGVWQIDARRSYKDLQQMAEWVTLLSAGFALP